ncbi:MAG: cytochrome c maturation protein CcmE [Methylocystis sp.]|jgi:cytochrome c-type biogenesis protein CcmE|nr:cytochrome c maturation protein CcmE [Methylocystis sp.]MCA3582690.1 cytochrome c maturation protein CcmE [Methylocystis sp.]MCA3588693.1 cytochrome c maturation protein CcmE [Methylocystis sp.]MCA3591987.1 cytochrome c maturation protein CcmE [Methylocystis sp.]
MTRKQRRMTLIGLAGIVLGLAAGLVLYALRDNVAFFRSPTEVAEQKVKPGERFRLGGLVEAGTVDKGVGDRVAFAVTDGKTTVKVSYQGILPDLFREGQGVVTEGILQPDGSFRADTVLAKHDETYMPREVADALKKQGHWKDGNASGTGPEGKNPTEIKKP